MEVNVKDTKCSPNSKCGKTAIFTCFDTIFKWVYKSCYFGISLHLFYIHYLQYMPLGKLYICAGSSKPCLLIDALTADISSIIQAIQNNSASSMFSIESISVFILFSKEFVYDIAH